MPGRLVSNRYGGLASGHPRLDETFVIEHDAALEPAGVWHGAGHDEHVSHVLYLNAVIRIVAPANAFEMSISFHADELSPGVQEDLRIVFDAPNEVPGHGVCQSVRPNQHVHALDTLCEEYRGLACGIASADNHDLLSDAELRFHRRRGVINAGAREL